MAELKIVMKAPHESQHLQKTSKVFKIYEHERGLIRDAACAKSVIASSHSLRVKPYACGSER